jgi:hypothetical protein
VKALSDAHTEELDDLEILVGVQEPAAACLLPAKLGEVTGATEREDDLV